jgi:hypothetical protein
MAMDYLIRLNPPVLLVLPDLLVLPVPLVPRRLQILVLQEYLLGRQARRHQVDLVDRSVRFDRLRRLHRLHQQRQPPQVQLSWCCRHVH